MNYYERKIDEMKKLRDYMAEKYGKDYMNAIAKLNAVSQYDENHMLRPELLLTEEEKNALLFYIPEQDASLIARKTR